MRLIYILYMLNTNKSVSKIFDTSTLQGLKAAERFQQRMYSKYDSVQVKTIGLFRVMIIAR